MSEAGERRELTVLIVDDDPDDLLVMRKHLQRLDGYAVEVIEASSGPEARHILARQRVGAILMDYRLGGEDGVEVLRVIRGAGSTCPVVVVTGQGDERVAAAFRRAGADDYLVKSDLSPEILSSSLDYVLARHADEEEQRGFEEALVRMATEDRVTGMLNRRFFLERLRHEVARCERYGRPLSLLCLDIDGFARVNELAGRAGGDQVLARTAVLLRGLLRTTDHFCRYDGDRFCVALTETSRSAAVHAAERLRAVLVDAGPGQPEWSERMTCTVAVRQVDPEDGYAEQALLDVFAAVARGKVAGGNRVVTASPASGQ